MFPTKAASKYFTQHLLDWHYNDNNRTLPWKKEKDPYKIWLSEIILQQTRAEQGMPYYLRFVEQYPDVHALADAPEDEVFRLWQGLGYYNRCRNLIATAREISKQNKGRFPNTFNGIIALKGIGAYTAAAIASFAFNLPYAVVDGNVYRVLARYFGLQLPIDSKEGKAFFQELANNLLNESQPAVYNQAIMDFGALICKPKAPACLECPFKSRCVAYKQQMIELLPVKEKKMTVRERHFTYLILHIGEQLYIRQRQKKDIWQHLYEYYLIESPGDFTESHEWQSIAPYVLKAKGPVFSKRQRLTHQMIISNFHIVTLSARPPLLQDGIWIKKDFLKNYAFPLTILSFSDIKDYF